MTIPVDDITGFPASGTVKIDQEVMDYDGTQPAAARNASAATAPDQPGFLLNVKRAVNGTAAAGHQIGTMVILVMLPRCAGDCDEETAVTVNEIITMVNIALGNAALSTCPVGDGNANRAIEINEIIAAVSNALNGCQ